MVINAAGSRQNGGYTWFDPAGISMSSNNDITKGKIRIPLVTVDAVNDHTDIVEDERILG